MRNENYEIVLSARSIAIIVDVLSGAPYRVVAQVLADLDRQVRAKDEPAKPE